MKPFSLDIWFFQDSLTRRLAWWSLFSLLVGAGMMVVGAEFWLGIGLQFLAWGAIDLAIAVFGAIGMRKRKARLTPEEVISSQPKERANLAKILWINTGLDVLYVAGGIALISTLGTSDPFWRGGGWGIIVQGGFLFVFDLIHALLLR